MAKSLKARQEDFAPVGVEECDGGLGVEKGQHNGFMHVAELVPWEESGEMPWGGMQ